MCAASATSLFTPDFFFNPPFFYILLCAASAVSLFTTAFRVLIPFFLISCCAPLLLSAGLLLLLVLPLLPAREA
jgi:hypothetical protein